MARIFGLDFGTTNSVAALIQRNPDTGEHQAHALTDAEGRPHPSVVWYTGSEVVVGRQAKDQMTNLGLGVFGDIVRSPKMFLGSSTGIHVGGVSRSAGEVVTEVLKYVRKEAIRAEGGEQSFDRAVVTVPVAMDGRARRELREAALFAGLHVHQFVHEPLAALYGYLRSQPNFEELCTRLERKLVLVFDWGGGTLDLTLCRISRGTLVQIANHGENEVGGDQFDMALVKLVKRKHSERFPQADWSRKVESAERRLIAQCERAKIQLSERAEALLFVKNLLGQDGPDAHLDVAVTREELVETTRDLVMKGLQSIDRLLETTGIPRTAIEMCLVTGGMASMPAIREGLIQYFDAARVCRVKNSATIIAEGAAWIAHDGARVALAKSIEVLIADDSFVELMRAGQPLPVEGERISEGISLYCVDPRDGKAKIALARCRWPGRDGPADPRRYYGYLSVEVDPTADPLYERIELTLEIDDNCIARARAESKLTKYRAKLEITNLEFGLKLPGELKENADGRRKPAAIGKEKPPGVGAVRIRSNVTDLVDNTEHIPGDLLKDPKTAKQKKEKMYYVPCLKCGRNSYDITRFGCDSCAKEGRAMSRADAERLWRKRMEEYRCRRAG